jgi:hypothetical protein
MYKIKKNTAKFTQPRLADKAGFGLRFVRTLIKLSNPATIGYQVDAVPMNRYMLTVENG